jgi:photosystem II stability/assembly factor-like uncharacterized protein
MRSLLVNLGLLFTIAGTATAHSLGWAVGPGGVIAHSDTSGATWFSQVSGTNADLHNIEVTRWMTGVAVGSGGTILHTIDGGATWSTANSPTTGDLHAVAFGDARKVWVAGTGGKIFYSSAIWGTGYWELQSTSTGAIYGIDFIDSNTGWAVGTTGKILHTSNGGSTWSAQASGTSHELWDVDFVDESTGWVVGPALVLHTTDGGETWSQPPPHPIQQPTDVDFIDADRGWIAAPEAVYRTQDGGTTWTEQDNGNLDTSGISFVNENIGTIVGRDYATFRSLDAVSHTRSSGSEWQPHETPGIEELEAVTFVPHADHILNADVCRSQCELAIPGCEEIPRSSFLDFPDEQQRLIDLTADDWCTVNGFTIVEGTCASGDVRFLRMSGSVSVSTSFYDAVSLRFTGLTTGTDAPTYPCYGSGYWPDPIACPNGVVTAVHCGTEWEVGEAIPFPTDGTLPIEGAFVYLEDIPALPAVAFILLASGVGAAAWRRLR